MADKIDADATPEIVKAAGENDNLHESVDKDVGEIRNSITKPGEPCLLSKTDSELSDCKESNGDSNPLEGQIKRNAVPEEEKFNATTTTTASTVQIESEIIKDPLKKEAVKRRPEKQLDYDNWDQEDEPEEMGVFQKASDDQMKKRVVLKAKRKNAVPVSNCHAYYKLNAERRVIKYMKLYG